MIQKEKKSQVILENATHEGDTGSPEVQIAILTARINELTEHLKTHRGSDTTNSELYTADILRNALNVKSRQLSTGRSIDEMAGEDADTWRGVDTGRVTQENGLFRRDAGRPTHIKRACGIASQTLHLYMYDAILRRRLTSRRRCRSDRPCCRCSGPDSRRWYSAPPPWARPRPRSRSGALPWCHRRT